MSRSDLASPGGSTALSDRWTVRSAFVNAAGLLAPDRRRQDHVGELGRLGQECVLDDEERVSSCQDPADPAQLGQRHGGVGADDPEEPDRARLGVAGRSASRGSAASRCGIVDGLDIPDSGEVAMWSGFSQLRNAANSPSRRTRGCSARSAGRSSGRPSQPGLPIMPAHEMQVVDLDGGGGRLDDW